MYNQILVEALSLCEEAILSVLAIFQFFLKKMPFLSTLLVSSFAFMLSVRFIIRPIFGSAGSDLARGVRAKRDRRSDKDRGE